MCTALDPDHAPSSHPLLSNTTEIYTFCHTTPHRVLSQYWNDSCCYRQTLPKVIGHPIDLQNPGHTYEAYPPVSELSFQTARLSEDERRY